jgi:hypothetical protein
MNVLFVNATRTWGGVKTWMVELATFLAGRGHGVTVACRPGNLLQAACAERGLACHAVRLACEAGAGFTKVDGPSFLRDKDIGILVSDTEPFAWAILEYMASSCAVVASAVDGPLEMILDGVNGLLVAPGNHAALAAAVRSLLECPERRESLAKGGFETVCRMSL